MLANYLIASLTLGFASFGFAQDSIPCGFKMAPCPTGKVCIPNSADCTNTDRCAGTCGTNYSSCGGFVVNPKKCDDTASCLQDPRYPNRYGMVTDLPGICVPKTVKTCTVIGETCEDGLKCYDNPRDDCRPYKNDKNCPGICL